MNIIKVEQLAIPDVRVIKFEKFLDSRGYFIETFRKSDVLNNKDLEFMKDINFIQFNESYSKANVLKGLHFQWKPPLGKLLRTISGHMIDMILDIRKNSPTLGKIILYDMPSYLTSNYGEWIWLPSGVAHGSFFLENSIVEYFFTENYNPAGEAGISPLSQDFDWSLCTLSLKEKFDKLINGMFLISGNDKKRPSFSEWLKDSQSDSFI